MIDHLLRDLQVLRKADFLIGKIWLRVLLRRFGLFAFAGLIALFGLAMANVAGFYGLQMSIGPVWAAAVLAVIDLGIALVAVLVADKSQPGAELDFALEVRRMALQSIEADARDLKAPLDALGQQFKGAKEAVADFAHNPLDVAANKLLIPAVLSLLKSHRAKKE
jgi:hypothetical protein